MKKIIFFFIFCIAIGCNSKTSNSSFDLYKTLFKDSTNLIIIDSLYTIDKLYNFLILNNCDSLDYTGNFSLNFNFETKTFSNINNENSFLIEIQGFLCPNSLLDLNFSDLQIEYNNDSIFKINDSMVDLNFIREAILLHFTNNLLDTDKPRIRLKIPGDLKLQSISLLVNEIILSYYNLFQLFVEEYCNNQYEFFDDEEFKELFPLIIKIESTTIKPPPPPEYYIKLDSL